MTTTKTVEQLAKQIIDEGCCVYTNDAGNGCGGPGSLQPEELESMLDDGELAHFEVIGDREEVAEIMGATLQAHNHKEDGTRWIVAERVEWTEGCQQNPYRSYLLLWD
jgi:hypothetical protein